MAEQQAERYVRMLNQPGTTLELELGRGHLEAGRTFSEAALDEVNHELATWVGTRLIRRFDATQEPPSLLRIRLTVEVG